jgi:hypothetical protein
VAEALELLQSDAAMKCCSSTVLSATALSGILLAFSFLRGLFVIAQVIHFARLFFLVSCMLHGSF